MFRDKLLSGCFILLFVFLFVGCAQKEKLQKINLEDTVQLKEPAILQQSEINICVGSMITPEEGYAYYKKLLNYLGQKLDMKVNFIQKSTYAEANALLRDETVDVAFVCGGPYVEGHDEFGLELLAAPLMDGKVVYYSYIIVAQDSGIERLEDLKGKVFAFADPLSNSGKLVPTYMLYELGETPQSFFKESLYTYSHDKSIKAVAQGIVDGAAVDSLIWNYMHKKKNRYVKETKIIKISKPYGIPPVVVRPGLDQNLKKTIRDILLKMHNEEKGKQILNEMFIDKFIVVDDDNYNTIRETKACIKE